MVGFRSVMPTFRKYKDASIVRKIKTDGLGVYWEYCGHQHRIECYRGR